MSQTSILIVEDDSALREAMSETLSGAGFSVITAASGREALSEVTSKHIGMVISDVQMSPMDGYALLHQLRMHRPDLPVIMVTAFGSIQKAVKAIQKGAVDYLSKPFEAKTLLALVEKYIPRDSGGDEMIAVDISSRKLLAISQRVAKTNATVMITGESGVGKEVLARFIHQQSDRADGPFIAINCAAIPENMLEATLFGYEKGAFTGAYHACVGKFEQAQGGTLLLDEVSEMDMGLQAKLLRVLQEREVERLGGKQLIKLDIRVLATSNRDLSAYVRERRFREDLYYRLNVFPVHMAALRDRQDDIMPLAFAMLASIAKDNLRPVPELSDDAKEKLLSYPWPGNVRELENVMQRSLIIQPGDVITAQDISLVPAQASQAILIEDAISPVAEAAVVSDSQPSDLKSNEHNMILNILKSVNGSRKKTAERLGISQRTLRYKLSQMRDRGLCVPPSVASI